MAPETAQAAPRPPLQLPVLIATVEELGRLLHELSVLNDTLLQLGIRTGGTPVSLPKTSRLMQHLIETNGLNLLQLADRDYLMQYLVGLRTGAPKLHISFSADPSPIFIEKLIVWLRREIHPQVLLTIGLQPNIGAGCIVRTANHYFDLSLRQDFADKRDLLLRTLSVVEAPA